VRALRCCCAAAARRGGGRTVDVVADAGAVGRVVVVAEDLEALGELADGHLGEEREEVARAAARVLANLARRVRAGRVEVAQRDGTPLLRRRVAHVLDDELGHELGAAVARLGLERRRLGDGALRGSAVHGRRRRVDEVVDLVLVHDLCARGTEVSHRARCRGREPERERGRRTSRRLIVAVMLFS